MASSGCFLAALNQRTGRTVHLGSDRCQVQLYRCHPIVSREPRASPSAHVGLELRMAELILPRRSAPRRHDCATCCGDESRQEIRQLAAAIQGSLLLRSQREPRPTPSPPLELPPQRMAPSSLVNAYLYSTLERGTPREARSATVERPVRSVMEMLELIVAHGKKIGAAPQPQSSSSRCAGRTAGLTSPAVGAGGGSRPAVGFPRPTA